MHLAKALLVPVTLVSALTDPSLIAVEEANAIKLEKRQNTQQINWQQIAGLLSSLIGGRTGSGGSRAVQVSQAQSPGTSGIIPIITTSSGVAVDPRLGSAQPVRATTAESFKKTTWDPPAHLVQPLKMVWGNYTLESRFTNWVFHQIYMNKGYHNWCVKWETQTPISKAQRALLNTVLQKQIDKWIEVLAGYDGWDYPKVPAKIVSWAASSPSALTGLDAAGEGFRFDGAACNAACDRSRIRTGKYPNCPGGEKGHHDMTLTLWDKTKGGGQGGDWGNKLNAGDVLKEIALNDPDQMHIFVHEVGHGFGLDDFYQPANPNNRRPFSRAGGQTRFLMRAGSARFVTEFDAWMLRNLWTCLGPRIRGKGTAPAHCASTGSTGWTGAMGF